MIKKSVITIVICFISLVLFSQKQTNSLTNIDTLCNKGAALYVQAEYNKAITIFKACVILAEKNLDKKKLSTIYNNLGNAYSQIGNSVIALNYYEDAIKIAEKIGDTVRIAKTTKNIGTLYSEQGDFKNALMYYDKAEKIAIEINITAIIADCLNNKGVIYEQQKIYDEALNEYSKALKIYETQQDTERIALTLNNIGIVYKYLKNYLKSIQYYNQSIQLSRKMGDQFIVAANLNNVANVYVQLKDYKKALELYFQSLDIAKRIDATAVIIEVYDGMATCYYALKQYPKAFEYKKLYDDTKSNFINIERTKQIAEMQTKYETEKKETQIKLLEKNNYINTLEISEQNSKIKKRNILIVASLLFFVLIGIILYFKNQKQKTETLRKHEQTIKETEENERLRMAKDIHDDLGSGLSKIKFLSELVLTKTDTNSEIQSNLKSISNTSMALVDNMRDLIWALNSENNTIEDLIIRIREYSSDYLTDFPIELTTKIIEIIPTISITKEAHKNIFFILKECLQNSIKHSNCAKINLEINIIDNQFQINVADNGNGLAQNHKKGNGLQNIKQRVEIIGGTVMFNSNKGLEVKINVPIKSIQRILLPK